MKHNKKFTPYNYSKMSNKNNKFLVIHWVAAVSTAKNNADYFASKYVGASAHYFVDGNPDENQAVWQIVGENNAAWHVGASKYYHPECRNTNSIGIEICCINKDGKVIMDPVAIDRAAKLAKSVVDMWGIKKVNILRHWDVTHKNCPAEFVTSPERWNEFINKIYGTEPKQPESENMENQEICQKFGVKDLLELSTKIEQHCGTNWDGGYLGSGRVKNEELKKENEMLKIENSNRKTELGKMIDTISELNKENELLRSQAEAETRFEIEKYFPEKKWVKNGGTLKIKLKDNTEISYNLKPIKD